MFLLYMFISMLCLVLYLVPLTEEFEQLVMGRTPVGGQHYRDDTPLLSLRFMFALASGEPSHEGEQVAILMVLLLIIGILIGISVLLSMHTYLILTAQVRYFWCAPTL
jgi:hypothetical protein